MDAEPKILTAPPDETAAVDVDVTDLETIVMTRAELRAHEQKLRDSVWAEARRTFGRRAEKDGLVARVEGLESFVLKLAGRLLDRIEASGPSSTEPRGDH